MKPQLSPCRTVVTNFGTSAIKSVDGARKVPTMIQSGCLEVAASETWVSCGLSNGDVNLYDQERLQLMRTYSKLTGEMCTLTDLTTCGAHLLTTCSSSNGRVTVCDVRQPTPALAFDIPKDEEALSVSLGYDGVLAAVGSSNALVHFHDIRTERIAPRYLSRCSHGRGDTSAIPIPAFPCSPNCL